MHLLLFVALFFLALRTPLPLPGEEGVEVNLGYTETGSGAVQSDTPPPQSQPTPPPPQPKQEAAEPEPEPQQEENLVQDVEEAPAIEEKEEEKPPEEIIEDPKEEEKEEPVEEEVIEEEPEEETVDSTFIAEEPTEEVVPVEDPKPVVNTKALYPGSTTTGDGTNQGNTEGPGDMGKPQGAKDSEGYDGQGGKGNGISFSLGGRGSKYLDKPSANFKEQGTVVVDIWVNRQGVVAKAQVKSKGTTVLDPDLRRIAVDAAKNSTFSEDPSAGELQRGSITYNFILMK